jgi:hypothetical protein
VISPVTNRGDCIGLLEATLQNADDTVLAQIEDAAHALAYIIVTDRRFTDLYHVGRRTTRTSLAAEIQHQLLPSASCCEAPGSPSPPAWSRPTTSAGTHTTTRSIATHCTCPSPTPWATTPTPRCSPRSWSALCAAPAAAVARTPVRATVKNTTGVSSTTVASRLNTAVVTATRKGNSAHSREVRLEHLQCDLCVLDLPGSSRRNVGLRGPGCSWEDVACRHPLGDNAPWRDSPHEDVCGA